MASVRAVNVANAATQTLTVRLLHTSTRQPKSNKLTAFGGFFVSAAGDYIIGEALFFGKVEAQNAELKKF